MHVPERLIQLTPTSSAHMLGPSGTHAVEGLCQGGGGGGGPAVKGTNKQAAPNFCMTRWTMQLS